MSSQFAHISPPDLSLPFGQSLVGAKRGLTLERNRSFTMEAVIEDENGLAKNITGWLFNWKAGTLFEKSLGDGITIVNAAAGVVRFNLSPAFVAGLPLGPVGYNIVAQTDANETQTVLFGTLTVIEEGTSET